MKGAALALCGFLLGGCAGIRISELGLPAPAAELAATPFFPQDVNECGPAALATVLAAGGLAVTPDELAPSLYVPGRQGSLQAEMVATSRRYGRVPYPVSPHVDELLATVAGGTPVLVLQNLALPGLARWHYAVVVGYDGDRNELILRSGTERRQQVSLRRFLQTWSLADRWALAVVAPETPPARAQARDWLLAASAFEELQQPQLAGKAYVAATQRWPDDPLAWQVLANLRYAQRDLAGAEEALRAAHRVKPAAATLNNLASVLLEQGCPAPARAAIGRAATMEATEDERAAIERTRGQIEVYRGPLAKRCGAAPP